MSVKLATADGADVTGTNPARTTGPSQANLAGFGIDAAEVSVSTANLARLVRALDASPDYRSRVGIDQILWHDVFCHGFLNGSKYKGVDTTMTKSMASGRLNMNSGNAVASGNGSQISTFRTFPLFQTYPLYVDMILSLNQLPQTNSVHEFGLGYVTGVTAPTDAICFRIDATGALLGVVNYNGSSGEVTTSLTANGAPTFVANQIHHYLIVATTERAEFWIDDILYGVINALGGTTGLITMSSSMPLFIRQYNAAAVGTAVQTNVEAWAVTQGDMGATRTMAHIQAGFGNNLLSLPDGVSYGMSTNYANSTAPVAATLSNTAAGYTTLGGQWSFAAVVGSETDYALFGYQVPQGASSVPGKNLFLTGIHIEAMNTGAAVATTLSVLQWALGIGSTAVSLATADSATAGTRAPRKIGLGLQSFAIGAAIGVTANAIDIQFNSPLMVESGTFIHVILRCPVGTATASQVIRGICELNGYFE